jgi:hypothetical protein
MPSHATLLVYDSHTHYFNLLAEIKSKTNLFPAPPHSRACIYIWSGMERMQMVEAALLSLPLLSSLSHSALFSLTHRGRERDEYLNDLRRRFDIG